MIELKKWMMEKMKHSLNVREDSSWEDDYEDVYIDMGEEDNDDPMK